MRDRGVAHVLASTHSPLSCLLAMVRTERDRRSGNERPRDERSR